MKSKEPIASNANEPLTRSKLIQAFAALIALGVVTDFLFNGVLKILWISIYGPVYLGIAASIYNYAHVGRWRPFAVSIAAVFLSGAALGHLALTGRTEIRTYPMSVVSLAGDALLSLQSSEFSDRLFIISDKLQKELAEHVSQRDVPITVQVIKNYGCIESFKVTTVDGVDVISDPQARWIWKHVPGTPVFIAHSGKEEENHRLLWCRIQWF